MPQPQPPLDLSLADVVIAVFHMPNCGACEAYLPMLEAGARRYGAPFVVVRTAAARLRPGQIPIVAYDVSQPDPEIVQIAERFGIAATPSTAVLLRGPGTFKVDGALADNQIDHLLAIAADAQATANRTRRYR